MADRDFNFVVPLKKDYGETELIGIASTTSVDRDSERMSETALKMMVEDIKTYGVNLFEDHQHGWQNTLGVIKDAKLIDKQVHVKVTLDDPTTNPKVNAMLNKLKKGINLGLSVGGNVLGEKYDYDKTTGKKVKVLDKVKIYEISVVGIPSNADSFISLPQAIAKSFKESKQCPVCNSNFIKKCNICFYEEDTMEKSKKDIEDFEEKAQRKYQRMKAQNKIEIPQNNMQVYMENQIMSTDTLAQTFKLYMPEESISTDILAQKSISSKQKINQIFTGGI
jgi:HK97 family phage prohead protease